MTLDQLKPLLAYYNAAGAVLRVLETGGVWTVAELVRTTGKTRSRVYAAVKHLVAAGQLEAEGSGVRLSQKRDSLTVPKMGHGNPKNGTTLVAPARPRPKNGTSRPENGTTQVGETYVQEPQEPSRPENGTGSALPLVKEGKINPVKENLGDTKIYRAEVEAHRLPQPLAELWLEWIPQRRRVRHPVGEDWAPRTARRLLEWVEAYGLEATRLALKDSVDNCYRGVFEDRARRYATQFKPVPSSVDYSDPQARAALYAAMPRDGKRRGS